MYAIIEDKTKQYKVEKDQVFDVDFRDEKQGDEIVIEDVLYVKNDKDIKIGTPYVDGAKVICEVIEPEVKGKKVVVFKIKRRKGYRRKQGHRQKFVRVRVKDIQA